MNLNEWKKIMKAEELKGKTEYEIAEYLEEGTILHIDGVEYIYETDPWTGADTIRENA